MTVQQRRRQSGLPATVQLSRQVTDRRGNRTITADGGRRVSLTVWVMPQRSSKAEVPGQQQINVTRIGFVLPPDEIKDVTLWSRIELLGEQWDFAAPPTYHHGTRHTRHWSADIRVRP